MEVIVRRVSTLVTVNFVLCCARRSVHNKEVSIMEVLVRRVFECWSLLCKNQRTAPPILMDIRG